MKTIKNIMKDLLNLILKINLKILQAQGSSLEAYQKYI